MKSRLDRLLASIHPTQTIEPCYHRANEALNRFSARAGVTERWGDFHELVSKYLQRLDGSLLRLNRSRDEAAEMYERRCIASFREIYGPNGEKTAFEMARTGNEGGLYAVLKALTMHAAEARARQEIIARIDVFLEDLSLDEQSEAASEYLAAYGHLLPSEMTESSAARIRAKFHEVLEKHPFLLLRLRSVGR